MKLYTRTGDRGATGLVGGQRVEKDHLRVDAYGELDEVNSFVGLARVACRHDEIDLALATIQNRLFEAGADLATPRDPDHPEQDEQASGIERIGERHIAEAEQAIDAVAERTPPLSCFVLPGGSELAARLHVARTVCRRAERALVTLGRVEPIGPNLPIYLNRLSDLLFALARRANQLEGQADTPWIAPRSDGG